MFPKPQRREKRQTTDFRKRGEHSEKPISVIDGISRMFPTQQKIELFARNNYVGWDNWGLEIPGEKTKIPTQGEIVTETNLEAEHDDVQIYDHALPLADTNQK